MAAADPSKQTPLKAVQVEALVCSFLHYFYPKTMKDEKSL